MIGEEYGTEWLPASLDVSLLLVEVEQATRRENSERAQRREALRTMARDIRAQERREAFTVIQGSK